MEWEVLSVAVYAVAGTGDAAKKFSDINEERKQEKKQKKQLQVMSQHINNSKLSFAVNFGQLSESCQLNKKL